MELIVFLAVSKHEPFNIAVNLHHEKVAFVTYVSLVSLLLLQFFYGNCFNIYLIKINHIFVTILLT